MVNTVLGPVDASELGVTLMHEHIVNIEWNIARNFPEFYDKQTVIDMFCREAEQLKDYGVRTWVDPTPITLGRDVSLLRTCAEKSGMNIIACTGLYWNTKPFFHYGIDPKVLAELMLREVAQGMEGTDSRPGFLKCAGHASIEGEDISRNMLIATAMVSRETGLPIYTHTHPGTRMALTQKKVFDEYGIPAHKVAYGHTFSVIDEPYIRTLLTCGAYAGCDQLGYAGNGSFHSLEDQIDLLERLFREDLHHNMFLSCDWGVRSDFGGTLTAARAQRNRSEQRPSTRRRKILFETVIPELVRRGISREKLLEVFINNPRRYFAG